MTFELNIKGQIRGGKNNMGVTKNGFHFPNKKFVEFRNMVVNQIKEQYHGEPLDKKYYVAIKYVAGDRRKRDLPMIIDSLWHCLVRAGVFKDDCLDILGGNGFIFCPPEYDKKNPHVKLIFSDDCVVTKI